MFRISLYPVLLLLSVFSLMMNSGCKNSQAARDQASVKSDKIASTRTLGLALLEDNDLEAAEAQFRKLIKLLPNDALGYANLGLVYLRMGKYDDARTELLKALDLSLDDPDIRFNLATVYKYLNEHERFIHELELNLESNPEHIQSLYRLAESYAGSDNRESMLQRKKYLAACTNASPANIVPRLHLIENYLQLDSIPQALSNLRETRRIFPEFADEALDQYNEAFTALTESRSEDALSAVRILHNFLKLTNPYQNGISELKGYEGSSVGMPAFIFSSSHFSAGPDGSSILNAISFTDVTEASGLSVLEEDLSMERARTSHMALGDFDHDGSVDIYLGSYTSNDGDYRSFMFKAGMGRYSDLAPDYKLRHQGEESFASFTDYDNDGWFDMLVISNGHATLYRSEAEGVYKDVSRKAFKNRAKAASSALFFDMDHEGDLDLLLLGEKELQLLRNNGDGTFQDYTRESGLDAGTFGSREAVFGDFDDDGDIDLLLIKHDGSCRLFSNIREGRFRDISQQSGLADIKNAEMASAADYNNDGYLDLFIGGSSKGSGSFFLNKGKASFEEEHLLSSISAKSLEVLDAGFFDFDNDGYQDLFMVGAPFADTSVGAILLHNDGEGSFQDASGLLPDDLAGGRQFDIADFNNDGDMDIFLTGLHGGVRLLRNDGGNINHHLKVRLRGIRTGSGKNNHYGIGAKIELRAGQHYQMKTVTSPVVQFGLAGRSDVDVVRILWTNGTPQNIFDPGTEQDLIEEQQLKGSCPFLYAWNGDSFEFVKDVMWRSALGMPMGIMGEEQSYAFADASEDYYKIPGRALQEKDGKYTIQITEELWETIYMDKVELMAVDHPESFEIFVDEHFIPPPYPPLKIYTVEKKISPVSAQNGDGHDVLDLILEKDDRYLNTTISGRYQGLTNDNYLVLDPGIAEDELILYLNGWIFPTDASINLALSQGENERPYPPCLQVINRQGEWETVIDNIGFPQGKNKTIITELKDLFLSADHRVRICTNMQIYWDHAFFSLPEQTERIKTQRLQPISADHHYRGFSRLYRKGSEIGPHWFDYACVEEGPKWRDLEGAYTRFGEVGELLLDADNKYIIANAGEETTIVFDADQLEELPAGWTRDFLIYSVGWVKDGDMNTAEGNRVWPLPYHGMPNYPYADPEAYPMNEELRAYHQKYNTRQVSSEAYRRAVYKR